jgi:TPR repeat protein
MKKARRMAQRGDWKDAALIWERLSKSDDSRVSKRSLYNLAVAAEMEGDFEKALGYARKAANQYGLRQADQYISILGYRMAEIQRLDYQMQE